MGATVPRAYCGARGSSAICRIVPAPRSSATATSTRVARQVDPHLEVAEIVQRVLREAARRCCSRTRRRGRMPLPINVFGTQRRMAQGARRRRRSTRSATRIGELLKPELPRGLGRHPGGARQGRCSCESVPPKKVQDRARARRSCSPATTSTSTCCPACSLARGRRRLPQPRPDPHQAPGDRRAQPRPVPAAAARRSAPSACTGRSTRTRPRTTPVAERRGERLPVAIAFGCRPGRHLRGDRAAARRHRRVPVRRVPARRAGRDGRLPDGAAAGAGARAGRARGLARAGRAAAGGAVRRPHRLLHAGRAVPGAARRVR